MHEVQAPQTDDSPRLSFDLAPSAAHARALAPSSDAALKRDRKALEKKHRKEQQQRKKAKADAAAAPAGAEKKDVNFDATTAALYADDTPAAFRRIMAAGTGKKRVRDGLDDGVRGKKNKKARKSTDFKNDGNNNNEDAQKSSAPSTTTTPAEDTALKLQPNEPLSHFSARVNQALPLSGLSKSNRAPTAASKAGLLPRAQQTRTEKKIQRKIAAWRVEDAKRREQAEDEADERDLEDAADFSAPTTAGAAATPTDNAADAAPRRKKGRRDDDDDPWAALARARGAKARLHDVAQAPPTLTKVREKFRVRRAGAGVDVANVPGASGSLARREALRAERGDVIAKYRAAVQARRVEGVVQVSPSM